MLNSVPFVCQIGIVFFMGAILVSNKPVFLQPSDFYT